MRTTFIYALAIGASMLLCTGLAWADTCASCHQDTTPGITASWESSSHAEAGVLCADCHGSDTDKAHSGKARVDAALCGACHEDALKGHNKGAHGAAPPEDARRCGRCHEVRDRCDSCHGSHGTDTIKAGSPGRCASCHGGSVIEAWASSPHGGDSVERGTNKIPACAACHMSGGSHNVSTGIASRKPANQRQKEREAMVGTCMLCHSPTLAQGALAGADHETARIRVLEEEALALAGSPHEEEAIASLARQERVGVYHRFRPAPEPHGGSALKQMLDTLKHKSKLEQRLIMLEARVENFSGALDEKASTKPAIDPDTLKCALRALKDRFISGKISEKRYEKEKNRLLNKAGL